MIIMASPGACGVLGRKRPAGTMHKAPFGNQLFAQLPEQLSIAAMCQVNVSWQPA